MPYEGDAVEQSLQSDEVEINQNDEVNSVPFNMDTTQPSGSHAESQVPAERPPPLYPTPQLEPQNCPQIPNHSAPLLHVESSMQNNV